MLSSTTGVVIRTYPYSETSVIAKIYTQQWGMQSFMLQGVKRKKAAIRPSYLQPLSVLELVVYFRPQRDLQRLREAKPAFPLQTIPYDMAKTAVALFMAEVLQKTVQEEEPNDQLFEFLTDTIHLLDEKEQISANFPIAFLLQLSTFLGFSPGGAGKGDYFYLDEGTFNPEDSGLRHVLHPPETQYLKQMMALSLPEAVRLPIPRASRLVLLESLVQYYQMHVVDFRGVNSLSVLQEVLRPA